MGRPAGGALRLVEPVHKTYGMLRMSLEFFWPSRRVTQFDEFCLLAA
jgi:hypothetical protein